MVNNEHENNDEAIEEITDENPEIAAEEHNDEDEISLEDIEDAEENKLKKMREKLARAEEDKRAALEELATVKADFLNARKRLEEDSKRLIERKSAQHMEALLPLADSFHMAMGNKEIWEKADENWRKGIEGINAQLLHILKEGGVEPIDPTGDTFDPSLHEAIGTQEVAEDQVDTVVSVMQMGYQITQNGTTTALRPARVTTGIAKES